MFSLITVLLSMLMATGADYTISLPFKTLEHPERTAYDEGPHDIELLFTLDAEMFDGEPDEDDVQNAVDQCFAEAQFLAPVVFYSGSGGYLSLLLPPNTTPNLRTFNFRYDRDRKGFSFSQGRLVAEEAILSVSSQRPLFPSSSDTREITMSGGTEGIGYTLCRDDEQLGTVTYQGASISFGHVNTPGTYRVSRPEGYTVGNEITLRLYDVFVQGAYRATDMQITEVPCDGGYASATLSLDRSISTYDLQDLETWFNTRQEDISFWPQLGQRISLCAETDNTYTVDIICPPNLSSLSRTFDTGMYLTPDGQGTLKFIQQGGGTLEDFNVTGTALNAEETFNVSLSGSQLGVNYSLIHEGETVSTMTGTGLPLTFRGLTMSGVYSVVAEYCYHTRTMTDTYTAAVPGEPGGSNYIATHQYVGDGTSAVTDIMYYGGLGYPVQEVRTSFVEKGSDLVRGIIYDSMGRPDAKVMLPYTRRGINSHYDVSHISSQEAYYRNHGFGDGTNANKVNAYETGESGRLLSSRREGDIYSELDRKVTYGYRLNVAADEIRKFIYTPHTGSSPARVETDGTFPGSSLKVVCITDEDNRTTETFSDMSGNIILERKRNADEVCDTYYIYDIRDSLVCVIQPMGVREMGNGFDLDSEFAQKWCFTYRYDSVGNMTERHVPGCGTDVMAYDLRGRLVLSSNALQRHHSKYRYYLYDELGRVMRAETDDGLAEDIRYDANGNILSLCRTGNDEEEKTVSYDYDGNQVIQTDDDGSVSRHTYYPNGNLLAKTGENLQFSYNFSNLLTAVRKNGISRPLAEVIHLADGTKTAAKLSDGSTLVYHGRFVYKVLANGRLILESVEHDHGRFVAGSENTGSTEFIDTWHVRDYLGSVRAVYDITPNYTEDLSDVILEQNDYYVFGGRIDSQALPSWSSNRYRFNGKEQLATATADLGLTDYGARMYSQKMSRWTNPDPLADKYFSTSPYAFCGNNPVNYIDQDGRYFTMAVRRKTITIEATYLADAHSYKSAKQAVSFWNNRIDTYVSPSGKQYSVRYVLNVALTIGGKSKKKAKDKVNTYKVVNDTGSKNRTGGTTYDKDIIVLYSYAIKNPLGKPSTTGAHEIGHTLGMEDSDEGIMSRSQYENRTNNVSQENIKHMINSASEVPDLISRINNHFFNIYEKKKESNK